MRPAWEYATQSKFWSPVVIYNDETALVYDGEVVHAIDIETGKWRWKWKNPRPDRTGWVRFENLFKFSGKGVLFVPGESGQLYELEANTGQKL
jgi:outer membrane protein assembly factor BamB